MGKLMSVSAGWPPSWNFESSPLFCTFTKKLLLLGVGEPFLDDDEKLDAYLLNEDFRTRV